MASTRSTRSTTLLTRARTTTPPLRERRAVYRLAGGNRNRAAIGVWSLGSSRLGIGVGGVPFSEVARSWSVAGL